MDDGLNETEALIYRSLVTIKVNLESLVYRRVYLHQQLGALVRDAFQHESVILPVAFIDLQTVDIMPWQAVLGGKVQLSTVAGRLQINLPANSQSGKSIRLKGKGIPAKISGDLYLNIRIIVPHTETDADRAAWEQLAAHFSAKNK